MSVTSSQLPTVEIPETPSPAWLELRLTVPLDAAEAVTGFLWELETGGVTEEAAARHGDPWLTLKAYVPATDAEALKAKARQFLNELDDIFPGSAQARVSTRPVEEKDWNAAWKEHFKPFAASSRLVIRPVWVPYQASASDVVLDLDPGMAFGTGTHESTRGCLQAIDALFGGGDLPVQAFASPAEVTVLDVGTGSGILLIAALLLGARSGIGVDLDPLAVTAAKENCALNTLTSRVEISDTLLQDVPGRYPLVLANILAPTLIALSGELMDRLTPDGALVLAGLLQEQAQSVLDAFCPRLHLESSLTLGEWTTLCLRAPRP